MVLSLWRYRVLCVVKEQIKRIGGMNSTENEVNTFNLSRRLSKTYFLSS